MTTRERNRLTKLRSNLLHRCYHSSARDYPYYGGRGITVCRRWRGSLTHFINDVGPRPFQNHSLDRIDNNGPYSPGNCRWATRSQQQRNSRANHYLTFKGRTRCLTAWIGRPEIPQGLTRIGLTNRICTLGWSVEQALTEPVRRHTPRLLTFRGHTMESGRWAREAAVETLGLSRQVIYDRYFKSGWSAERALTVPPRRRRTVAPA